MSAREIGPDEVVVNVDDLRLLISRAEPLLVSPNNRTDPIVGAIDRLGDKACVVAMRRSIAARDADRAEYDAWHEHQTERLIEREYVDWVDDRLADGEPLPALHVEAFLEWADDQACAAAERRDEENVR